MSGRLKRVLEMLAALIPFVMYLHGHHGSLEGLQTGSNLVSSLSLFPFMADVRCLLFVVCYCAARQIKRRLSAARNSCRL